MNIVAIIDDLFCYPYINRKNELLLWLAALKQKSFILVDVSPMQSAGTHSFIRSFNEYLLSTFTVLNADFYQKTPYLVSQENI